MGVRYHSSKLGSKMVLAVLFLSFINIFNLNKAQAIDFPAEIQGYVAKDLISDKAVTLSFGDSNKVIALVFLSTRCPCSFSHLDSLKKLYAEFHEKKVDFIGIHSNADEPESEARAFFLKQSLPFPVLQDNGARIADLFLALKTPHVFLIKGKMIKFHGGVDNSKISPNADKFYLKDALTQIVNGQNPILNEARTLGCIIKRP